jgi:protein SCO1
VTQASRTLRLWLAVAVGLVAWLGACSVGRLARAQSGPFPPPTTRPLPEALREVDIDEKLGMPIPGDLTFTDETGKKVRLGDLFRSDKPIVLVLAYYHCPMLCDLVLEGTVVALKRNSFKIGKSFSAVTISFDPRDRAHHAAAKKDTVIHALGQPGAAEHWPFLVGDEATVKRLTDAVGYRATYDAATDQYGHPAAILILTPDGRVSRYLYGITYADRDVRFSLIEASGGKIGSITDRIIMSCFRYDPASRRYGVYIFGFLRIGSGVVLAAVAALILTLLRRERRKAQAEAAQAKAPKAEAAQVKAPKVEARP